MITVVIPVGTSAHCTRYLQECLDSLKEQSMRPTEIILVDDMAHLNKLKLDISGLNVIVHRNLWHSGQPHSVNYGIALSSNELIFMLNSDDKLKPWALEDCLSAWNKYKDELGYYWCDVEYSDTGEYQRCATSAAMVTKTLWKHIGGYPIESSIGMPDTILISILLKHKAAGNLYHVMSEKPPYWYRRHLESMTETTRKYKGIIQDLREIIINDWILQE